MNLEARLSLLERNHDWSGLQEALEHGIASSDDPARQADYHFQLGRLLRHRFLQGAKALKHFQDAYKLNAARVDALAEARAVYWELGKLNMVQKLLELQLKSTEGMAANALFCQLGDVLSDLGDADRATEAYARALQAAQGQPSNAGELLHDVQVGEGEWQERMALLLRSSRELTEPSERAVALLRAARITRRFAPDEIEGMLMQAYAADPMNVVVACLLEDFLTRTGRTDRLLEHQKGILAGIEDPAEKAGIAFCFGTRWAMRHQNHEVGAEFMEASLAADPSGEAAFAYLREVYGTMGGDWARVVALADTLIAANEGTPAGVFMLAAAGTVSWRQMGDLIRARAYFERLAEVAPEHSAVKAFEAQIGHVLGQRGGAPAAAAAPAAAPTPAAAPAPEPEPEPEPEVAAAPASAPQVSAPPSAPPSARPASAPPPPAAAPAPRGGGDEAKIAELRHQLAQQEAANRHHEYVKTLVALGDEVVDASERVGFYEKAAELYVGKFMNQAEAVKVFEKIIEVEPAHPQAVEYLIQMYEKRRDWEKLISLRKAQAEHLPSTAARVAALKELANLATEKVRKPEVCIDLWAVVVDNDPEDVDALNALAQLYERARDYEKLADVLQKLVDATGDTAKKIDLLNKLGQIAGDRLKDEERAVEAYRMLLILQPDDRRAQEQLKKRYVTLGRWDDLEVFYADSGKWDEFIRVLETHESKAETDEQRIGMLLKIAELWMTQKGKPDRSARAYEKILSFDPNHLDAAQRLIPIYQSMNNPKGLATALEVKLNHVTDPNDRLELLREAAALYETRIKDTAKAFERYVGALEIAPSDVQCQSDAERVAELTGRWEDLITAYRGAIKSADDRGDTETVSALRLRLGRVLVEEVKRVDDALVEYRSVYEAEPENAVALQALEQLYRQTSRWKDLLEVYEKRRDLAYAPEERKPILYEIARLYETQIGDAAKAVETYRAVLEDDPVDAVALAALDALYQKTEDWESYAEILRRRIELDASEGQLIDLKYRLGQAEEKHLQRPAVALETYREILFLESEHEGARTALEGMLENAELRGEAASILESIYEVREDWEKLVRALEILVLSTDDQARRVELLRKIAGTVAGQLGDRARAFEAQARAVREDPSLADAREELESFAEAAGWDKLIALYGEVATGLSDASLARQYWLRLASIEERLGRVADAAQSYTKVLELDPADAEALLAMDALYRRTERWEDLISVFRRRIELADEGPDREALYAQMAGVYEEKLGKPDEAIAAYREVLSLDPTSQVALGALESLFMRQRMWAELAENLETRLGLAESEDEQIRLMLRLASLREREMGFADAAIEGYRQILERDPANREALEALERLGTSATHELAISEILEPLYRQQGDYQKLIGVYEVQVRRAEEPERKVELLHGIAQLYEDAASDANSAFDTFARALAVDPANEVTQEALDRLARVANRFPDLAKVFEQLAAGQSDPELGSRLYTFAARVVENHVGDVERAIELYRRVLSIDPANLGAAEALQALFQATERFSDMSLILQSKAGMLADAEEQKAALYQAATLEEEVLERPDQAIAVYKKVLELDAEDLRSVDALINLYLRAKSWPALLDVYSKKADLVGEPEEKKLIYYEVGAVYEREIGDVQNAIDTYQKVLELDPDDLTALGRLDALYQASQNWAELLTVLTHEAELTAEPSEAISFQYRIAELYEKHLSDMPRAVELYRDILGVQPDHAPTLAALEGIKDGSREPLSAASVLEPVYEAMGEWLKLVSVLEVQVRFAEDPFAKVDLLHRIAALYEESLSDPGKAFDTYARAVGLDSQNEESLTALERLAMTTERWPAVATLYDAELDKLTEEPQRLVELGLRVAQVYEVQLESVDNAVARFRRVLQTEPENQIAVRALDRLFTQAERWSELAEILAREAEIGQTPDEILEFKYRLGSVFQLRLNDVDRAIAAYSEVINAAPEHADTLRALEGLFESGVKQLEIGQILEPLYQSAGEWEKLIRVHEAQLAAISEPEERIQMYYRIAEDAEERLSDPVQAFRVYVRALKERPLDEKSGDEIERLAGMIDGGWEELANAYADVMSIEGLDAPTLATIGRKLARVFEEELADVQKAEESYRFVLSVAPREPEALSNLDRIYSATEQFAELAGILEQRAQIASEEREKVELYGRLGQVYEEQLRRVDDAIVAYRKIFDQLEPNNQDAIAALARIYEGKEAWTDLKVVYGRQLENAVGDVEEAEIRAKLATVASERLGNVEEAIEGWKRVLDLRGEDPEALLALSNLYERQERWAELSDVLERHFDIAESDEDRVGALTRRARLFTERLGRDDEALETWQRVLDIDYANVTALRSVADVWRRRNDANELVAALHSTVDRAGGLIAPEELKAVFRELGKTYGTVLEQPYDAAEAWRKLLEVDPADMEAMEELEKLYRAEDRWADVVSVKMQRAEALPDTAEKIRELLEVTEIWKTKVEEYDRATSAFEKVLSLEPTHEVAFTELEKLHRAAGRWEPLVEMYLNRLETVEEVPRRSELLRKIAGVFEQQLEDNNQAFDALVNAFSEDYADDATSAYLEKMAQATGRWGELINTANAWLQEQDDPQLKIQLCLRLGKWYGEDLGHPEYAQPYYAQVMQLDPNNVRVIRQMANIYRIGGNWQKMGETLTKALNIAVANEDRRAIQYDLGELLEKQMGQADQGVVYYKRSLEVDPLYLPSLEALERIYSERGQTQELLQILTSKAKAQTEPELVAQTSLRMGDIYERQLRDLEKAGQVYRDVLEVDGGNLQALRGLERVSETLQRWSDLVDVLERQLDVVQSERERIEVLLKLATIQEEQFLKADVAAQRLEQVIEIDHAQKRAYVALERCYRRLKQWLDLIGAYERHISDAAEPGEKPELFRAIAQVYADEVGDNDQAISAYQNIVDLDETNIEALEALSKLYEKQGDTAASIDAMIKVADLSSDGTQRVEMYYRIGKALDEKLGDRVQAQERFEMALDLNPAHLPSLAALRTIAVDEADWDRAATYLEQEQQHTEQPRARAKLLVELGKVRDEQLSEHELAIQAYELAIQADGDCEEAALPLVEEYIRQERWSDGEPLAEMLVRKSKGRERQEQHMLNRLLGKIHAALGNDEKAMKAYQAAHQLDVTDQETIRGIAEVAYKLQDWPSSLTNYQKVLTALGEEEVEQRTEVYYRLGCIKREQGQAKQAINNFEKALALNSEHRPTLEALVDLYAKSGDWKQVAAYKRQILDSVFDEAERFKLLVEIGDVWGEKEKNSPKAIEAFEEARDYRPQDHVILHKLLQLYQSSGDWQKMVDTLQAIGDLETAPERKSRYFYTMAQLYRDKLEDQDRAVELFNEALDQNPQFLEAFERINKILTQDKNWKQLERNYRKMLHRIAGKGNTDLEFQLWHQLGLIYRDRIAEIPTAIEAFKMAATLRPEDLTEKQILSELYESTERYDDAIREQRSILEQDALRVDPYRALYRLYLHKQTYDEAWCVASAMAFMRKADAEEQRFFEDYRPPGMLAVRGRLTNDHWVRHLFHADENIYISKIFEMIAAAALQAKIAQLKMQNKLPVLNAKFKQDPASSTVTFAKTFGWAGQVLGVAVPELYVRSDVPGSVVAVPAIPPASVAGQTVLSGFTPQELAFLCGKHLASYRGEHYIRTLFPTQAELTIMLFAGVMIAAPNTPMPPDIARQVQTTAQELAKYMEPVQMEGLRTVVKRFIEEGAKANIRRWSQAVELTACRAGLLVSGDLEIAKKILAAEPTVPGDLSPAEKMKELLLFSVSEQYTALRKALGVAIATE